MANITCTFESIKNAVVPIAAKYQIKKVYLFGSYARGDYSEESDIDLRIEKGNLRGMFALCGFYSEVEKALQKNVDILTTGSLEPDFLRKISEDEVLIYERQP
ncbi:MAG: nucleotidyltransferase domain-containing protein [Eubacterium sp.]|nr:nucleotidyltransferase domain-containing protein [Eubacterium sp.]